MNPVSDFVLNAADALQHVQPANFTGFSLRELNILIKRGENELVRNALKKCMLCGKCTLVCPRGVNTRNIVVLAKKAFQKIR